MAFITQVVSNDWHVPYHDPDYLDLFADFCKQVQPDEVHLLGDLSDFPSVSLKFRDKPKDERVDSLQWECGIVSDLLKRFRDLLPGRTVIYYYEGNHEHRLVRYLRQHAKPLWGISGLSIADLWDVDWVYDYGSLVDFGNLNFTHGDLVRKGSGVTARAALQKYGVSVLMGHTHRGGAIYHTDYSGTRGAWENFCGCKLQQPYNTTLPDWQQGWSIVHNDMKKRFQVHQIEVLNGWYVYGGMTRYAKEVKGTISKGVPQAKI